MQIFHHQVQLRDFIKKCQQNGQSIGLVPTMGALHQGHLALINASKALADVTVASVFVNPLQFNNQTDFQKYPQVLDQDIQLLSSTGCDVVFAPLVSEIYPQATTLKFDFGQLETVMEGKFRPGHFNGVGIIVSKLFNLIRPNWAFFGQKDLQQCAVIKCLANDLSYPIEIKIIETLRESDGLAMSSRNRRLSNLGRSIAPEIFASLQLALSICHEPVEVIKLAIAEYYKSRNYFNLEYFEVCDPETLYIHKLGKLDKTSAFCIAVHLEDVRLIDNVIVPVAN